MSTVAKVSRQLFRNDEIVIYGLALPDWSIYHALARGRLRCPSQPVSGEESAVRSALARRGAVYLQDVGGLNTTGRCASARTS
jgi:hypothetical protein